MYVLIWRSHVVNFTLYFLLCILLRHTCLITTLVSSSLVPIHGVHIYVQVISTGMRQLYASPLLRPTSLVRVHPKDICSDMSTAISDRSRFTIESTHYARRFPGAKLSLLPQHRPQSSHNSLAATSPSELPNKPNPDEEVFVLLDFGDELERKTKVAEFQKVMAVFGK